ncbi:MAG TPA: hypothetical protein VFD49_11270 [Candidatus Dormibacteraeota bacterium]|nr:hypothetical protein [Candidatus Dormibacteraeota bacterium]
MAAFRLMVYEPPARELRWTRGVEIPRWVLRLYQSYGRDVADAPLSASIEALGEGLGERLKALALAVRKMEARGWNVALDGADLRVVSALSREETVEALRADGVWTVVRELAIKGPSGDIAWL